MSRFTDTIAALATPVGESAIAVLRVSGPDTKRLAADLLGAPPPPRQARRADYRAQGGELVDDVLCTFFQGPHSYTGEDTLEISCHGNPFIARRILDDLFARGCRPAEPGAFTQRAFLNGRMDLSQAEAVMDLIHARSERALEAANQQLRGSLGRRMSGIVDRLLDVVARVEAYIDFPDEDLPPQDRAFVRAQIAAIKADTAHLLATRRYGELLRDGIRTVIAGAPNVGKSSLLNRLVGHERVLVSPEPGTTRDFVEERLVLGAHCLRLVDTAGINQRPAPLEQRGIAKSYEQLENADLVLAVVDASLTDPALPDSLVPIIPADRSLIVLNKIDLANASRDPLPGFEGAPHIPVSAKTGAGINELREAIGTLAESYRGDSGEEVIAINARHALALASARDALTASEAKLESGDSPELLASDLRAALHAFEEIGGRIDNEQILDRLFSTFCIGK